MQILEGDGSTSTHFPGGQNTRFLGHSISVLEISILLQDPKEDGALLDLLTGNEVISFLQINRKKSSLNQLIGSPGES